MGRIDVSDLQRVCCRSVHVHKIADARVKVLEEQLQEAKRYYTANEKMWTAAKSLILLKIGEVESGDRLEGGPTWCRWCGADNGDEPDCSYCRVCLHAIFDDASKPCDCSGCRAWKTELAV